MKLCECGCGQVVKNEKSRFCSGHSNRSEDVKKKKKETCLLKYGVSTNLKTNETKQKIKQTCLKKYGVENSSQSIEIKQKIKNTIFKKSQVEKKEIIQKRINTCIKKYGGNSPYSSEEIKNKGKETCLEKFGLENIFEDILYIKNCNIKKYGVDNYSKTHEFRELARKNMIHFIMNNYKDGSKFLPTHGKNEEIIFNEIQLFFSYKLLEDQEIGNLFPDRLLKELNLAIELDEPWHSNAWAKKHDKIKDEYYISKGYTVLRIKESDWFEDKELQIIKVQETIKFLEQTKLLQ